ncbi:hypothetical protein [Planococcus sp. MB-3u-03]|uniref:hypothetical protein n=1 Tax=Planococcus sp. MB-3u-03 TaxID=2058136 RepID=UPI001E3EFB24|nr:hypothetical protein [Planococcus sp. MB-3u-03]
MQQFEIVPDERWVLENVNAKLILRTIVHVKTASMSRTRTKSLTAKSTVEDSLMIILLC